MAKVSQELAAKVNRYQELESECNRLYEEICSELIEFSAENADICINGFAIFDEPLGDPQGDGEFCDQYSGYIEDDYHGTYFYPIEDSDKYLGMSYSC